MSKKNNANNPQALTKNAPTYTTYIPPLACAIDSVPPTSKVLSVQEVLARLIMPVNIKKNWVRTAWQMDIQHQLNSQFIDDL